MKLFLLVCCCLPLRHLRLSSGYGYRIHPVTRQYRLHSGIDLRARHDTVFAIAAGHVQVSSDGLLGLHIRISDGKLSCLYGHLSAVLIRDVTASTGQPIAITGASGRVTGEHLHLSISFGGRPIDPLKFLYQITQQNHD